MSRIQLDDEDKAKLQDIAWYVHGALCNETVSLHNVSRAIDDMATRMRDITAKAERGEYGKEEDMP